MYPLILDVINNRCVNETNIPCCNVLREYEAITVRFGHRNILREHKKATRCI